MSRTYIVTGAGGHLGNTLIGMLGKLKPRPPVRALAMKGEHVPEHVGTYAQITVGDVREPESLKPLFEGLDGEVIVIHTAGVVSIASKGSQLLYDVNVEGTKNLLEMSKQYGVAQFLYVSSVHAIPEAPHGQVMAETEHFDPDMVKGAYAKTKAAATSLVLRERSNLAVQVVHPSGIMGPGDYGHGHLTQLMIDYMQGGLKACVKGGYDFVDVRDVAAGILLCIEKGKQGACYILSNSYIEVEALLEQLHQITGNKRVRTVLPMWFAKMTAPLAEYYYKLKRQPPLFTSYSLYTLSSNANYSHEKATAQLGYAPRPHKVSFADAIAWLTKIGRVS